MGPEIKRYPNVEGLSSDAAGLILQWAKACVRQRGVFTWVLSGGRTPLGLYACMASAPFSVKMDWSNTHLFWGDERCVPPDHPESNFSMADRVLISKVPIPQGNVHRIPVERPGVHAAAKAYEEHLRGFFGGSREGRRHPQVAGDDPPFPTFDLILLGVGRDGHTASLYPGDPASEERTRWVSAVPAPKGSPPVPRVTLTLPVINRGRCVLVLVSGVGKREVMRAILEDPGAAAGLYPAASVHPEGRLTWMIDDATV